MAKLNLTPWQLTFVKILVDNPALDAKQNKLRVYANTMKFTDTIFKTYQTSKAYAKEIGNTKMVRDYNKANKEMVSIVADQIDDLIEREVILNFNKPGERNTEDFEIKPRYAKLFSIAVMGMPAQLHDEYPHFIHGEGGKKYPAKSCSEAEIAAEYLKNIGNSEEEHLQVLEDVKWAKVNNQIVMGLVKFVQSKNWLAIREQRKNGFVASTDFISKVI